MGDTERDTGRGRRKSVSQSGSVAYAADHAFAALTDEAVAESGLTREKFIEENVLLAQPFVKEPSRSIEEKLKEAIAKLGENIVVRRFTRYEVGA